MILSKSHIQTPLGEMVAIADECALCFLSFADGVHTNAAIEKLTQKTHARIVEGVADPIRSIENELNQYFAGTLQSFSTPVHTLGTPFQQQTWRALSNIPYGTTCSYKTLATAVGKPSAFRAVANANGKNQFAIMIPCHRVINANGGLGGYSTGLARKRWLLDHEQRQK